MPHDCHFCRQLAALGKLPSSEIVWRFPHSVAFLGAWQFYHGYCVLVSRRHVTELSGLEDAERRAYLDEMCLLAKAIAEAFHPHKMNYELLGNQVPHLHWHLFPRFNDDPARLKPVWLALEEAEHNEDARLRLEAGRSDRAAITAALREQLVRLKAPDVLAPHVNGDAVRLGTRGSSLALWQANHVAGLLRPLTGSRPIELVEIQTTGDFVQHLALAKIGGDGVFTKEIQRALVERRIAVAVHSLKDLPTTYVEGLTLAAVPARGPTGDAFISRKYKRFDDLPPGATVATSSLRRRAQLSHRRPDLKLVDIRGNVDTRLRKLADRDLDGLILAEAGLVRLGLADQIAEILDPAWMLPAAGQGALGLECRADDAVTRELLQKVNDPAAQQAVLAERALLRGLGGGCQVPIGAAATVENMQLKLRGVVLSPDGSKRIEEQTSGPANQAEAMGKALAGQLLAAGAKELLALPPS
jgi:hydroxymethylbilane synthase